jgi:hypothetical protein
VFQNNSIIVALKNQFAKLQSFDKLQSILQINVKLNTETLSDIQFSVNINILLSSGSRTIVRAREN